MFVLALKIVSEILTNNFLSYFHQVTVPIRSVPLPWWKKKHFIKHVRLLRCYSFHWCTDWYVKTFVDHQIYTLLILFYSITEVKHQADVYYTVNSGENLNRTD